MDKFTKAVIAILSENGCRFVRHGKGDHDIWFSPISNQSFPVDSKIPSRHWANGVLMLPENGTRRLR